MIEPDEKKIIDNLFEAFGPPQLKWSKDNTRCKAIFRDAYGRKVQKVRCRVKYCERDLINNTVLLEASMDKTQDPYCVQEWIKTKQVFDPYFELGPKQNGQQ